MTDEEMRDSLHDRAMSLPSLGDLRSCVSLPQHSATHIDNLEGSYVEARAIILELLYLLQKFQ